MATLRRQRDGRFHVVPARCVLGRAAASTITLDDPYASGEHARMLWTGSHWEIRDLGSRNGTFLDGKRLEPGRPYTVGPGARLGFGGLDADWCLEDASSPGAAAVELDTGRILEGEPELLVLPGEEDPAATVYPTTNQGWMLERADGETVAVSSQQTVQIRGRAYRLELPVFGDQTPMVNLALTLDNISLRFDVSRDEERVETVIILHGKETRLEAREHAYLLLTLARLRERDRALPEPEQGWVKVGELSKMLRLDDNAINVAIHRARQQLARAGVEGAAGVVETARGRRRLGVERFEVGTLEPS